MEYFKTPNNTNRLQLLRTEMPENQNQFALMLMFLDILSIWGGADENNKEYLGWEFPLEISESMIREYLNRLNCKIK